MSFGYSPSKFLRLLNLAKDLLQMVQYAPFEYKNRSNKSIL
jgi:hypothetical protein